MSEQTKEHSHDFDGIVELDNELPRWWLGIFYVSIALAIFYVPYYHFINPQKLPQAALMADLAERRDQLAKIEAEKPRGADEEAVLQAAFAMGGWEASAKRDFTTFCVPCHAPDGGGTIGPNFTDDYYIHGGRLTDIQTVINEGVPAKGMISWKVSMKPEQIRNLTFYIRALRGTTPATAKAPEGTLVDDAGNFVDSESQSGTQ